MKVRPEAADATAAATAAVSTGEKSADKPGGKSTDKSTDRSAGKPSGRGSGENRPTPVSVKPIEQATLPEVVQAVGTVTALNTAVVRPRVDGVLLSVSLREGDRVNAGDVLAQIDPAPFEVAVRSAEGTLERDRALLRNAELDLQRFEDLWQKESVSRQQLDTQRALVQQLRGTVQVSQAALDSARLNLSYTRIKAPISGRMGLRQVDAGNTVRAGDANGLVTITQDSPLAVVFAVPDSYVSRIQSALAGEKSAARAASRGEIVVEAFDRAGQNRLAKGQLLSSDNAIDVATGTLRLKAQFANTDRALFPNQFVSVRLMLGQRKDVLVAPAAAIQRGAQGSFVYVVGEDSTVSIRKLETGLADGERVEVLGDVQAGMRVVTEGVDRLRPGAAVEVIEGRADVARPDRARNQGDKNDGGRSDAGKNDGGRNAAGKSDGTGNDGAGGRQRSKPSP